MKGIKHWRYSFGTQGHCTWAIVLIDNAGCFAILSDYGNHTHRWPPFGFHVKGADQDFRKEILHMHAEYIIRKLGGLEKEYDAESTLKWVKDSICRERRLGDLTKEEAKEQWDSLELYDNLASVDNVQYWAEANNISDYWEIVHRKYPDSLTKLIEMYLPVLKAAIREDLAKEEEARQEQESSLQLSKKDT